MNEAFTVGKKSEAAGDLPLRVLIVTAQPDQAAKLELTLRESRDDAEIEIRATL